MVSSVLHPLGFISSILITGKIFLHQLWRLRSHWDDNSHLRKPCMCSHQRKPGKGPVDKGHETAHCRKVTAQGKPALLCGCKLEGIRSCCFYCQWGQQHTLHDKILSGFTGGNDFIETWTHGSSQWSKADLLQCNPFTLHHHQQNHFVVGQPSCVGLVFEQEGDANVCQEQGRQNTICPLQWA